MQNYLDPDRDSGIRGYEITSDGIWIFFKDGMRYLYTNASAGSGHVAEMLRLALAGDGLGRYINLHVRKAYARKERG